MIRKIVLALIAGAAIVAASGIIVFAAAFALYALVRDQLGRPGAAAVVCLAAAVLIGLVGLIASLQARGVKKKVASQQGGLLDQLLELARERPIVSTSALIAAAAMAIRNPAVLASVVGALINKKRPGGKARP